MATTVTSKQIHPSNAYLVRQALTKYDPATNSYIVWTGAAGVTAGFYTDPLGTAPIATLVNIAMTESTVQGTYYAVVSGTLTATLAAYDGDTIYQIVTGGVQSDLRVVTPLVVSDPRYAQ